MEFCSQTLPKNTLRFKNASTPTKIRAKIPLKFTAIKFHSEKFQELKLESFEDCYRKRNQIHYLV